MTLHQEPPVLGRARQPGGRGREGAGQQPDEVCAGEAVRHVHQVGVCSSMMPGARRAQVRRVGDPGPGHHPHPERQVAPPGGRARHLDHHHHRHRHSFQVTPEY